ncbi:Fes1-domain-containing protein [Bimuria novae-zelandiae CBS 107.79]|uniref:Fes1-domain-containing protein n=1 Tax=Bimuria novae-zelandiae CBS 107.79 TaxID=1447943 RepID=A0A6A5UWY5_9PLEO|nr:Fes1-domain-containing protein [Bimuria novae-zelandiae CBS 107.79]
MNNPKFNDLLKWGIENSEASRNDPNAPKNPNTQLDPQTLQEILSGISGPSDAEMMKRKMEVITQPNYTLDQKLQAFEDFEMLVQGIDNANNLEPLKLWMPLIEQLEHEEAELRKYAAWCAGTAVENNVKAQERLLVLGALPTLVKLATEDDDVSVRKKAVRALSCATRNYQPALDAVVDSVPSTFKPEKKLDAGDMDSVDSLINQLRTDADRTR